MKAPPRLVRDTNVVLSALLFRGGPVSRVRIGWQSGRFVPLASSSTAAELVRVLGYPKFRLSPAEREDLLADFIPWVRVVRVPAPPPAVPACRNRHDAPFLQLAAAGRARALVTGHGDVLALNGSPGLCALLSVDAFCAPLPGRLNEPQRRSRLPGSRVAASPSPPAAPTSHHGLRE